MPEMTSDSLRVVVCHPGRQHSHQLAMALAEKGMLAKYFTGVPTHKDAGGLLKRFLGNTASRYEISLDRRLVQHWFVSPLISKTLCRIIPKSVAVSLAHRADGWFDRYAAKEIRKLRPSIVVCYENAAKETFNAAKEIGAITILDAASFHHRWQDRFFAPTETPRAHHRICQRKDDEIALADKIFTASEFARESYLDAGVPPEKVHAIPMGVDTELFALKNQHQRLDTGPLNFLFVGRAVTSKGSDLLQCACVLLDKSSENYQLTLIGDCENPSEWAGFHRVKLLGKMSHQALAGEIPKHDVLVLPSRFDSFGMVVAEAMSCGLPVIVTDNVGAKELVVPKENGLIVPSDDEMALAEAMSWFIARRDKLPQMALGARAAAKEYTWNRYRERVVIILNCVRTHTCTVLLHNK